MELVFTTPGRQLAGVAGSAAASRMVERDQEDKRAWDELLIRVRREETAAQRELVERLWPRVAGRIGGLCPRREEVEDLAQVVFSRVFERLGQYRGGSFVAWVDTIAKRACYDALRKQRVRPEWRFADIGNFDAGAVEDESAAADRENARAILEALFRLLPDRQVWLLTEVELRERSIGDVSREMGWTEVAGRLRLMRARRALKRAFESWEENHEPKAT